MTPLLWLNYLPFLTRNKVDRGPGCSRVSLSEQGDATEQQAG